MLTISTDDAALIGIGGRKTVTRVRVKDGGGTLRDLTTYGGFFNAVRSVDTEQGVDSPGMTADIVLQKAEGSASLAPMHESSPFNRALAPANSYGALLAQGREVVVETAFLPLDHPGAVSTWSELFRGYIDTIEWPDDEVRLSCRGLEATIQDCYIERERVYAFAQGAYATAGCLIFEKSRAYSLDELVVPTEANLNGHFYEVTTAGTSASSEPTWATGSGSTTSSGSVVFTERGSTSTSTGTDVEDVLQQIINDNMGGSAVVLSVPSSPSWAIRWYLQQRQSVWDALKTLVDQIGWDLRFLWDSGTATWKLTLFEPDRSKTSADATLVQSEMLDVGSLAQDIADIRNVVRVVYSNSQSLDSQGTPIRSYVDSTDSTSVSAFGRRFCEVAESSTSNIDTSTEATAMADAIKSDLALPQFEQSATVLFWPWVELGDLYEFPADERWYTTAQKQAVVSYSHAITKDKATTTFKTRGKVSGGWRKWVSKEGRGNRRDTHRQTNLNSSGITLDKSPIVGGQRLTLTVPEAKHSVGSMHEFHVSPTASFTPSTTTLVASGTIREVEAGNLIPGKTYYTKVIPYGFNASKIVRGEPSAETSFTAGRGSAAHLESVVNWGRVPLNGGFETQTDTSGPPDHWTVTNGTWDTDLELASDDSEAISGSTFLTVLAGATQRGVESGFFTVVSTHNYALRAFARGSPYYESDSADLKVAVQWYLYDQSYDSEDVLLYDATDTDWAEQRSTVTPPTGATFGKIKIYKSVATDDAAWDVDSVYIEDLGEQWHEVGASGEPAYGSQWALYSGYGDAAGFKRTTSGVVMLKGLVQRTGTGNNTTIFTLPVGYRPAATSIIFGQYVYNVTDATAGVPPVSVRIDSAGVVFVYGLTTDKTYDVSLDGIIFDPA